MGHRRVHQIRDAGPVNRADGQRVFKTEPREFRQARIGLAGIHLVDCDENRFATMPQTQCGFTVERHGPYEGPVTCHMTMKLGQDVASFDLTFDYHEGPHNIVFLSAARASSTIPTATARTSWGKIKAIYR